MALVGASGCSKKLSSGGNAMDAFAYDVLKMDRGTGYYYQTLLDAHDRTNFAYRTTDDVFLADKCVDAIRHLGDARYDRLEGEAQVILLLSDVLLEDPIVLAKIQAAEALTKLAIELPVGPVPDRPEQGLRYLALLKELDASHDDDGNLKNDSPAARQRVIQIFDEIGSFRFPKLLDTKNGLRFFPARAYVTRETDPTIRAAIDRAMVRRARAVVIVSLTDAVQESSPAVREAALRGLKSLAVPDAVDAVIERIPVESSGLVRVAMADYLGAAGGIAATNALVAMLDDDDASVRHHAHEALKRVSGRDYGREPIAWVAYQHGAPSPAGMPGGSPCAPPFSPPRIDNGPPSVLARAQTPPPPQPPLQASGYVPPPPPVPSPVTRIPTIAVTPPPATYVPPAPAPRSNPSSVPPPPILNPSAAGIVPAFVPGAPLPPPVHRTSGGS